MHESDAMQFIEIVLEGFFERNFNLYKREDDRIKEACFNEIRSFIEDKEPYWVKEKAREIIQQIQDIETLIKDGTYTFASVEEFLDSVFFRTKKVITDFVQHHHNKGSMGKTAFFVYLPRFP